MTAGQQLATMPEHTRLNVTHGTLVTERPIDTEAGILEYAGDRSDRSEIAQA